MNREIFLKRQGFCESKIRSKIPIYTFRVRSKALCNGQRKF